MLHLPYVTYRTYLFSNLLKKGKKNQKYHFIQGFEGHYYSSSVKNQPFDKKGEENSNGIKNLYKFWPWVGNTVADPGCLSRIRIFPSRIQGQ